jgi:hypothetical protein
MQARKEAAPTSIPDQRHYVGVEEIAMTGFWIAIVIAVAAIIGISVIVGKTVGRTKGPPADRAAQMNALKASGALKYRKSNRN